MKNYRDMTTEELKTLVCEVVGEIDRGGLWVVHQATERLAATRGKPL